MGGRGQRASNGCAAGAWLAMGGHKAWQCRPDQQVWAPLLSSNPPLAAALLPLASPPPATPTSPLAPPAESGLKAGHSLAELSPGSEQQPWVQSQTTFARLHKEEDGSWAVRAIKQKIWVEGVSYELQARGQGRGEGVLCFSSLLLFGGWRVLVWCAGRGQGWECGHGGMRAGVQVAGKGQGSQ